jgi:hypothetical protein
MSRLFCSLLISALAACSGGQAERTVASVSYEVVASAEQRAFSVTMTGPRVEIRAGDHFFIGEGKGDKRIYHEGSVDGPVLLEVKSSNRDFKLRNASSELLWKVRLEDDKIKVSDNAENERAWSIKREAGGEGKVRDPSEQVVGRVVRAASGLPVVNEATGNKAFEVRSGPKSIAYGALLMAGVPETHRQIIVTELLARGE